MNNNHKVHWAHGLSLMSLAKLSSLLKISFVFGTFFTWFSASSIMIPLIGSFGGSLSAVLFFIISLASRLAFGYGLSFKILAFYVPGLCASLYLAQRSALYAVVIPFLCAIAFIAHPASTFAYTLYWLIPVALFCLPKQTSFTLALTATFVAHAVGATIWIYTQPTTPLFWMSLMPIVALERLTYAFGMIAAHKILSALFNKQHEIRTRIMRHA